MSELLTLAEAARRTGLSRRTLGRMLDDGKVAGNRTDDGWRIPTDALDAIKPRTPSTSTADEIAALRDEVAALRAIAEAAEAVSDARNEQIGTLTAEAADLRTRAAVAEALAEERATTLAQLNARAEATDARLTEALDALTAAHSDLRQALTITGAVTGALTSARPDALALDGYSDHKRRRWGRRR
jgi:excisionase family DNA binding protein